PYIGNAGDSIRGILLFYLILCPSGAAWSLDSWRQRRRGRLVGPAYVYPWALRLLFLQMVFIYFFNGLYKVIGPAWQAGDSLSYVLRDLVLSRFSASQLALPRWLTQILTYSVVIWEVGFPLWVANRWTRTPALLFGVAFHLGSGLTMELGGFVPYMLVMYLPLVPWERWIGRAKPAGESATLRGQQQSVGTAITSAPASPA